YIPDREIIERCAIIEVAPMEVDLATVREADESVVLPDQQLHNAAGGCGAALLDRPGRSRRSNEEMLTESGHSLFSHASGVQRIHDHHVWQLDLVLPIAVLSSAVNTFSLSRPCLLTHGR